jgi:putative membrane-bound dehydrogenase-like protein
MPTPAHRIVLPIFLAVSCFSNAAEFTIGERTITVPDGFEIELAAGPPLVDRPISISRDERGYLYVTDSAGMSDRADKQLAAKPHRIVRLEDSDDDGKYDKSVVFADKMMFPEGCLWYQGSLYVAAPPEIWKLTDTNDDGVADKREVWFDGKTLTGCANDLHGPYLGPDGWFYWCKGAFAEQKYTLPSGKEMVTKASHIFRARPDGTGIEPVLTGGMDNPVGLAFLSNGERILSCTFFQHPADGKRDGLIHAIYGGVYGKKHDPIYAHPMTGDVMPVMTHMGAAAPAGIIAGSESLFGGGHLDQLFGCYFNLHKVVRHELTSYGATYKTKEFDFVGCEHPDFHPTDVFEDADGSLLVVDTGGWYKVCCPTSQLAKPDVLGAIYRVKKKGQPKVEDALGRKIGWEKSDVGTLTKLLGDTRRFVQRRAGEELRRTKEPVARQLSKLIETHPDIETRKRAVWIATSLEPNQAREVAVCGIGDSNESVSHTGIQVLSLLRYKEFAGIVSLVTVQGPAMRTRVAAEACGRIAGPDEVLTLARRIGWIPESAPDPTGAPADVSVRVLEHAFIYALIEAGNEERAKSLLSSGNPSARRIALVALDQRNSPQLQPAQIIRLLDDKEPILRNTATWIVSHRPAWGADLVAYFERRLAEPLEEESQRAELASLLGQLAKSPAIQELLSKSLQENKNNSAQIVVLRALSAAALPATPKAWLDELAVLLPHAPEPLLPLAVETARKLPKPKEGHANLTKALISVGGRSDVPIAVRLDALRTAGPLPAIEGPLFELLLTKVLPEEPLDVRSAAADVLGKASLSAEQRKKLLTVIGQVGPLELPKLVVAFERASDEATGKALIAALTDAAGFRGVRADTLKALLAKYPDNVQQAGQSLLTALNQDAVAQAAHLDKLLKELPPGDIRRGQQVFLGKKIACFNCHAMGYLGGKIGPDLTNIGKVRTHRDLLESIVYPSSTFVRSYEPTSIATHDGRRLEGIIARETPTEIVLTINDKVTETVPRSDIADMRPGRVSIMPLGVDKALTPQELADLVTFLKGVAP